MNVWAMLGIYVLLIVSTNILSNSLSSIFHIKWKLCDLKLMSGMYMKIWIDIFIGVSLFAVIAFITSLGYVIPLVWGFVGYMSIDIILDVRRYDRLQKSLLILNITTEGELEKFIEDNP